MNVNKKVKIRTPVILPEWMGIFYNKKHSRYFSMLMLTLREHRNARFIFKNRSKFSKSNKNYFLKIDSNVS